MPSATSQRRAQRLLRSSTQRPRREWTRPSVLQSPAQHSLQRLQLPLLQVRAPHCCSGIALLHFESRLCPHCGRPFCLLPLTAVLSVWPTALPRPHAAVSPTSSTDLPETSRLRDSYRGADDGPEAATTRGGLAEAFPFQRDSSCLSGSNCVSGSLRCFRSE